MKISLLKNLPLPPTNKTGFPWTEETPISIYRKEFTYPKITIITPSYNQGQFLEETIRSVLLQNYPNLEYIIIDGGSTDNSVEIIKKYEKWIDYWVSEPDRGQAHAINKGLEKATGEIFNWLNSDDTYLENALFFVGATFSDKQLKVAAFQEYLVKDDKILSTTNGTTICNSLEATLTQFHLDQPCTFFRLEDLLKIGKLREDLHYLFDAEMWIRYLLLHGISDIKRINIPIDKFRLHEKSKTVSLNHKFQQERYILLLSLLKLTSINNTYKILFSQIDNQHIFLADKIFNQWTQREIKEYHEIVLNRHVQNEISLYAFSVKHYDSIEKIPITKPFTNNKYLKAFLFQKLFFIFNKKKIIYLHKIWLYIKQIITQFF